MKSFIASKKNNLLARICEALVGLSVATAIFYYWQTISNSLVSSYLVSLFETNFNPALIPHFKVFTSAWVLIIAALLLLSTSVLLHHYKKQFNSKKVQQRKTKYQNFFANVVADESDSISAKYISKDHKVLKQHLSKQDFMNEDNRQALLTELKAMYNIISGNEKSKLRELYFGLGFVDELNNKFEHKNWHVRVDAIHETKQFGVTKLYPNIFRLVNDPNEMVRRNALIARVDLDDEPLSFLSDIDYVLSNWERHKILSSLAKLPSHKLPTFSKLYYTYPLHKEFLKELSDYFDQSGFAKVLQMA